MKSLALSLLVFAVSLVTDVARAAAPELPEGLLPAGYQVSERHVMNLGGSSGMYTDWQRYDLSPFEGLATMLEIPAVHGKPKDKFAAVTKIRFIAKGDGKQPWLGVAFMVDRKTERIHPLIQQGDETSRLDFTFGLKEKIPVSVIWQSPGTLALRVADKTVTIPVPFEIDALAVVGSGLDVSFSPFVILKKAGAD